MLDDGTCRDFAEPQAVQVVAVDHALQRRRQHVLIRCRRIRRVGAGERNPVAAEDRYATYSGKGAHSHDEISSRDTVGASGSVSAGMNCLERRMILHNATATSQRSSMARARIMAIPTRSGRADAIAHPPDRVLQSRVLSPIKPRSTTWFRRVKGWVT